MTSRLNVFSCCCTLGLSLMQGLPAQATTEEELRELLASKADTPDVPPTAAEIDAATFNGLALPDGQSALTVKTQVLLDRARVSPGIIDGYSGGMSTTAIMAFERMQGLPQDGLLDNDVWEALGGNLVGPIIATHVITQDEVASLSAGPLPSDYAELAQLDHIGYTTVPELVAEAYHMDEDFLRSLNPNATWTVGESLTVVNPSVLSEEAAPGLSHIVVDKATQRLTAYDASGRVLGDYPVTVGSEGTPSPTGTHLVRAVAMEPTYTYDPSVNFQQGDNTEVLTLPPGPNGPVGSIWIDLDAPTYGLHGTPNPDLLFTTESHGCVRMTNWDATEMAKMVNAQFKVNADSKIDVVFQE